MYTYAFPFGNRALICLLLLGGVGHVLASLASGTYLSRAAALLHKVEVMHRCQSQNKKPLYALKVWAMLCWLDLSSTSDHVRCDVWWWQTQDRSCQTRPAVAKLTAVPISKEVGTKSNQCITFTDELVCKHTNMWRAT